MKFVVYRVQIFKSHRLKPYFYYAFLD